MELRTRCQGESESAVVAHVHKVGEKVVTFCNSSKLSQLWDHSGCTHARTARATARHGTARHGSNFYCRNPPPLRPHLRSLCPFAAYRGSPMAVCVPLLLCVCVVVHRLAGCRPPIRSLSPATPSNTAPLLFRRVHMPAPLRAPCLVNARSARSPPFVHPLGYCAAHFCSLSPRCVYPPVPSNPVLLLAGSCQIAHRVSGD